MKEESKKLFKMIRRLCYCYAAVAILMGVVDYAILEDSYSGIVFIIIGVLGFFNLAQLVSSVQKVEEGQNIKIKTLSTIQITIIVIAAAILAILIFWVYRLI